jgi:molecular chaperone GrpE
MDEAKKKNRIPINEEKKGAPQKSEEALKLELESLTTQLADAQKEAASNLDGWQRERAEFSNYKKRIERDQSLMRQEITGTIVKKYLVILDDLELALKDRPKDATGEAWAKGIALITKKLYTILESEGIERIFENKVPFDPNIHEAISHEENEAFESGEVIEVFRQGYKLGDRTLRPAMVRVAK